jgi:hypothetical protein
LTDAERRLILETVKVMVYEAGRSTLVLALRGSRSKKLEKFRTETLPGYVCYRGMLEAEVLARIDGLFHEELLRIDASRGGFPLLGFTPRGLKLVEGWTAEKWLGELREHVADPNPIHLALAYDRLPNRNLNILNFLLDLHEVEAELSWFILLESWFEIEVIRVRKRLLPPIEIRKRISS